MKPDFAEPAPKPTLLMGSDVVWIDAATADPLTKDEILTISQMAEKFAVTPRALRFYESKGLLAPERQGRARIFALNLDESANSAVPRPTIQGDNNRAATFPMVQFYCHSDG